MRLKTIYLTVLAAMLLAALSLFGSNAAFSETSKALVNIELENVPVVDGIKTLFEDSGYKYSIDPGVTGKIVELTIKGVTFDQALKEFGNAADFTFTVEQGTYMIRPVKTSVASVPGRTVLERGSTPAPAPEQPTQPKPQAQQTPTVPAPTPTQVVVTQSASPVINVQPPVDQGYGFGGYYPPFYRAGNVRIATFGYPAYDIGSSTPYIINVGYPPLPPPGWLPYSMERFLRAANALAHRPYFTTPY